jgi:hypothetical protein
MNHSPEPWLVCGPHIGIVDGMSCAVLEYDMEGEADLLPSPVNMERIVACINACQGIPTSTLVAADQYLRPEKRAISGHPLTPLPTALGFARSRLEFPYYEENT